jgi:hypothetical protein
MIVEPTPTNPRSPLRRALRTGGLALPLVLLLGVAGAGLLGPRSELAPPAAEGTPPAAEAPSAPVPAAGPAVEDGPPFPIQFGDLGSVSPGDLVAARREGRAPEAVAVGGYLEVTPAADCDDAPLGPLGPWCERDGLIAETPWTVASDGAPSRPAHVHLVVPIGVRLPNAVTIGDGENRVLVVGRFEGGAGCGGAGDRCDDGFVVERFAWVDGVRVGLAPLIADRLDTGTRRPNPFEIVLDAADLPLSALLVWPDAIPAIDPAAAALAASGPSSDPVWYLRVLDGARGPGIGRRIRWMLLAETDLRVLGSGRPDGTAAGAGAG